MERTLDAKGRWRNRTVGFRVSEEEAKMIDRMVALSGLTKQEYILRKLMDWEVTVQGNPRVYKALKNQIIERTNGWCTEMEGTAVGQAAHLNKIPYLIIRAISDKADDSAQVDYPTFERQAILHSVKLVEELLLML